MSKRITAAVLWFIVGWTFGSMGSFFLGLPAGTDLVLSVVLAVVAWDPTGHLWAVSGATRRVYTADATTDVGAGSRLATK